MCSAIAPVEIAAYTHHREANPSAVSAASATTASWGTCPCSPPPDEVLDQFVDAKNEWKGREKEVIATTTNVPAGVNPNCGDPNPGDEVRLRREAHVRTLSLDPPIRSPEVGTSRSTR
jgi:hypothetical protein